MNNQGFIPPVVSVLGHVDHGKTTLLDAIRKSNVATREHGGITQKIGFSTVKVIHEGQKRDITFIDTPGHEAFANMRGRGAVVADVGLLIVSSVDGVMPQTKESISLLKNAKIPYIVVLTKCDSPEKNPEKVKQQLLRSEVMIEGYGGDIPVIEVSARAGQNIKELLDLILLVWSLHSQPSVENDLKAVVIESKLDPKAGPRASVIVKSGTLAVKQVISAQAAEGKVRSLINDQGEQIKSISAGYGAEVLGFSQVPPVGSTVVLKTQKTQKTQHVSISENQFIRQSDESGLQSSPSVPNLISLFLCADAQGSLEAILASLPKNAHIVAQKTGDISEADILFAKETKAIILTFNIKLRQDIINFAQTEKVVLKNYAIIYEMLSEINQVIEGKAQALLEQIYGIAKILATFPFDKSTVLGINVLDGRIARGDKIRIMRDEKPIGESTIVSLRHGKDIVSKVEKGKEGGMIISPLLDFSIGDVIISHS